jgi:hypothetical protein
MFDCSEALIIQNYSHTDAYSGIGSRRYDGLRALQHWGLRIVCHLQHRYMSAFVRHGLRQPSPCDAVILHRRILTIVIRFSSSS